MLSFLCTKQYICFLQCAELKQSELYNTALKDAEIAPLLDRNVFVEKASNHSDTLLIFFPNLLFLTLKL